MTLGELIRRSDEELAHFVTDFVREFMARNKIDGELEDEFEQKMLVLLQSERKNDE